MRDTTESAEPTTYGSPDSWSLTKNWSLANTNLRIRSRTDPSRIILYRWPPYRGMTRSYILLQLPAVFFCTLKYSHVTSSVQACFSLPKMTMSDSEAYSHCTPRKPHLVFTKGGENFTKSFIFTHLRASKTLRTSNVGANCAQHFFTFCIQHQ